jgi:glycerol-3-phosphate dehydrogenase (NAD(P)+)
MNFAVIGAGAWGTAFALHLARAGCKVVLLPRRAEQAKAMVDRRENVEYLAQVALPAEVEISSDVGGALAAADVVLVACPAQAIRETCARVLTQWPKPSRVRLVVSLAKGLESGTHLRPSEVIGQVLPRLAVGSLTGPTNAREVALGKPAAMVLAAASHEGVARDVQQALSSPSLRIYTSDDLAGAEFGGCLKNIYAIAAGCCDGLKLGDNTKAALLTRALSEMVRVGVGLGAKAETFHGLSGFGDLVATCYGEWSRNHEFGKQIGRGRTAAELMTNRKTVVEGYKTTEAFAGLCAARGLDAPILREVQAILFAGKAPLLALNALMTRELKRE